MPTARVRHFPPNSPQLPPHFSHFHIQSKTATAFAAREKERVKIQRVHREVSSISERICDCELGLPVARFQAQDIRLAADARCRCRCQGCWPGSGEFPHISVFVCRASCAQVSLRYADRRPPKK